MRERVTRMDQNGALPEAAACLYSGEVMHARLSPFAHRFSYRVFSLLIDIDRLEAAGRQSSLFSVERPNVVVFRQADHQLHPAEPLRTMVDRLLTEAGCARPARVMLLCYPRILGYAFNPISVYFAYDAAGGLTAVIYAVRNTFGERHTYVARVEAGEIDAAGVHQEREKVFHVSPFIEMGMRYHFRLMPPGRIVRLRIHETDHGKPLLSATFIGEHQPLDTRHLASTLLKIPLMTWKVIAGIHWEAAKLWFKGATFHKSPPPPDLVSFHDAGKRLQPGE